MPASHPVSSDNLRCQTVAWEKHVRREVRVAARGAPRDAQPAHPARARLPGGWRRSQLKRAANVRRGAVCRSPHPMPSIRRASLTVSGSRSHHLVNEAVKRTVDLGGRWSLMIDARSSTGGGADPELIGRVLFTVGAIDVATTPPSAALSVSLSRNPAPGQENALQVGDVNGTNFAVKQVPVAVRLGAEKGQPRRSGASSGPSQCRFRSLRRSSTRSRWDFLFRHPSHSRPPSRRCSGKGRSWPTR